MSSAPGREMTVGATRALSGAILLLTELYPPDVGGSAVLLHEGYSRLGAEQLTVVADDRTHRSGRTAAGAELVSVPLATSRWGIIDPRAAAHHLRVGMRLRGLADSSTVIHCGRALPEGVAAYVASLCGGPRYVCWTHGEDVTSALTSRELTIVMRAVHRRASALVANSANTRRILMDAGVPAAKIHVIYPGVDAERFSPRVDGSRIRQRHAADADLMLLSVGRLQRRKGHDLAISAVAALKASAPRLCYVIVGDGEERPRLEALARTLGVTDQVVFVGEVSYSELPAYFAASDVFMLPNRVEQGDIEGFGIVFLEAAAAEKPVIGGNSGGVPEAIAEEQTGLLVSGTDVDELVGAILRLAGDRKLRARLGRAGRARVLQSFTWTATAARIRAVHEAVMVRA